MKKIITLSLVFIILFSFSAFSQKKQIQNSAQKQIDFQVVEASSDGLKININIPEIEFLNINTKKGEFLKIVSPGMMQAGVYGLPELAVYSKLIEIPIGAKIKTVVEGSKSVSAWKGAIPEQKIYPYQPSISKSDDPDKVKFIFDSDIYNGTKRFSNPKTIEIEELGEMRGKRIARISICPFEYHPVTNELFVKKNLNISIIFTNADMNKTSVNQQKYYSPYFQTSLGQVINSGSFGTKDLITTYPVKFVIVSDTMFQSALQPFVEWKTRKGFNVIEAYVGTGGLGTTTTAIKSYLQGLYNAATASDPAPTFVLLVGDIAQIPTWSGQAASHKTDFYYVEYTNDNLPEVYIGRFSANNLSELQPQIDKTLEYEQYLMTDPTFLDEVVMVAGVDGSYAATHGNGQINYGTSYYFNSSHGITSHTYLYGSGSPITSNSSAAAPAIRQNISDGVGFGNYTAHCGSGGWSDPSFSTSHISDLENNGKYPLLIGNCCLSGKFDDYECFGEAIVRAANKGALGYIGASNTSFWNEDFWWGVGVGTVTANPTYSATGLGVYDRAFHDNGEAEADWYITQAQMRFAGNMAVSASSASSTTKLRYWEMYHLFGDPSLMVYFSVPSAMNISLAQSIPLGINSLQVQAEANAYGAISKDNMLIDAQIADAAGNLSFSFAALTAPGYYDVVITKQNRQPFIDSILVITGNQAFISFTSYQIDDVMGNMNGEADFSENILLNISLENLGNVGANSLSAVLSSSDSYVNIVDSIALLGDLLSSQDSTYNGEFQFIISNSIPDQHLLSFSLEISDTSGGQWSHNVFIPVNAPDLEIGAILIDDSQSGNNNNQLDPGESLTLKVTANNIGGAEALACILNTSSSSPFITILSSAVSVGNLQSAAIVDVDISVDPLATVGSVANFIFNLSSGAYSAIQQTGLTIGIIVEDWETNDFTSFNWTFGGDEDWLISSSVQYEGSYSAVSGNVGNSEQSDLILDIQVLSDDSISFFRKVSSESSYDFLQFWIDNNLMEEWSGTQDWEYKAYPITAGNHTVKWIFDKDYSVSNGSDCGWVDYIVFPPIADPNAGLADFTVNQNICVGETAALVYTGTASASASFILDLSGGQVVSGSGTGPYHVQWNTSGVFPVSLIVSEGGNSDTAYTVVSVNDLPVVDLGPDVYLSPITAINISAGLGFSSYLWNTGESTQAISVSQTGTYWVEVTNNFGCANSDTIIVLPQNSPWTYTNTGINHSILVPSTATLTIDGVTLPQGSFIGVFFDSLGTPACAGFVVWQGTTTTISAWGEDTGNDGFTSGETFQWKVYDPQTQTEYSAIPTYSTAGFPNTSSFAINGMSGLSALAAVSASTQNISLATGWKIISTYIDPQNPDIASVFASISQNTSIVKNSNGQVYWPGFGINNIGNMILGEAYQVKMINPDVLSVTGQKIQPEQFSIILSAGWKLLGYLRDNSGNVSSMLQSIETNISIVKNSFGLVYWPAYGINNIGNMTPGEGYQIKMTNPDVLIYPAN